MLGAKIDGVLEILAAARRHKLTRCHTANPLDPVVEVTLITEAGHCGDLDQGMPASSDQSASTLDTLAHHKSVRTHADTLFKRMRKAKLLTSSDPGHILKIKRFSNVFRDVMAQTPQSFGAQSAICNRSCLAEAVFNKMSQKRIHDTAPKKYTVGVALAYLRLQQRG